MKSSEHPKMYITQPTLKQTNRQMQFSYNSRNRKKSGQLQEETNAHSNHESIKPRKKFIDMNIEERIRYFLDQPFYAPKIKCEIRTKQRKYVGYIQMFENDQVEMLLPGRKKEITLSLDDIEAINLFGF